MSNADMSDNSYIGWFSKTRNHYKEWYDNHDTKLSVSGERTSAMRLVGLPMPRGTWLILVVAVLPVLASQVASAAPGYPVEDPKGTSYTVSYDLPSDVLTLTSSTIGTTDGSAAAGDSSPELSAAESDSVSGVVEGPNAQINHGQVMKQLHELTDGQNSGCLSSAVAQSDLGKGDQEDLVGEIDPLTVEVDCLDANGSGKSDKTQGKSDAAPGKSGKAPGRDR
jgi:hypothetical protein